MEPKIEALHSLLNAVSEETGRLRPSPDWVATRERLLMAASQRKRPRARPSFVWLAASATSSVLAAAAIAMMLTRPLNFEVTSVHGTNPGRTDTWLATSESESLSIDFNDGSRIVMGPATRGRVLDVTRAGAAVLLQGGHSDISITPRRHGRWSFMLGPFSVRVTGTKFALDWNPEHQRLDLKLHEGHVVVTGCALGEQGLDVYAGQSISASCGRADGRGNVAHGAAVPIGGETARAVNTPQEAVRPDQDTRAPMPSAPRPDRTQRAANGWRTLLDQGRYAEAYDAADRDGFAFVCSRASASELIALADAARLAGHGHAAKDAYRRARDRFPNTRVSSVATFTLARLAFDEAHDYSDAAAWFRAYIDENPQGSLLRESWGRLLESLYRAGHGTEARATANEYLRRFPGGPHSKLAKAIVDR